MTYLIYDGTFEGLISAIFDVYDLKLKEVQIKKQQDDLPDLFAQKIISSFDEKKFNRVKKKIEEYIGKSGFNNLWKVTLSELPEVEEIVLGVVRYALFQKKNILKDYGNIHVIQMNDILKKIGRERHRMTAFVRFKLAQDGIYYATVDPDFDVLPLISSHFKNRYTDQKWLIFDTKRSYGLFYDMNVMQRVEIQKSDNKNLPVTIEITWDDTEQEFQNLWKKYFKSTNIQSRKNTKLHLQHVPKRYWKYLVEKQ